MKLTKLQRNYIELIRWRREVRYYYGEFMQDVTYHSVPIQYGLNYRVINNILFIYKDWTNQCGCIMIYPDGTKRTIANSWYD